MLVGEAPGQDENRVGKPFVGKAGQELNRQIEESLLAKSDSGETLSAEDHYITNVVKCWPCNENKNGNRTPTEAEIQACSAWLDLQFSKIHPWFVIALGSVAAGRLTGNPTLGERAGVVEWSNLYRCPILITYHPAYILRNSRGRPDWKRHFDFVGTCMGMHTWEWHIFINNLRKDFGGALKIQDKSDEESAR